ncbi:putative Alkylated DNA repair protein, partial [Naja naja]
PRILEMDKEENRRSVLLPKHRRRSHFSSENYWRKSYEYTEDLEEEEEEEEDEGSPARKVSPHLLLLVDLVVRGRLTVEGNTPHCARTAFRFPDEGSKMALLACATGSSLDLQPKHVVVVELVACKSGPVNESSLPQLCNLNSCPWNGGSAGAKGLEKEATAMFGKAESLPQAGNVILGLLNPG